MTHIKRTQAELQAAREDYAAQVRGILLSGEHTMEEMRARLTTRGESTSMVTRELLRVIHTLSNTGEIGWYAGRYHLVQ